MGKQVLTVLAYIFLFLAGIAITVAMPLMKTNEVLLTMGVVLPVIVSLNKKLKRKWLIYAGSAILAMVGLAGFFVDF